jgi:hypothetical protein
MRGQELRLRKDSLTASRIYPVRSGFSHPLQAAVEDKYGDFASLGRRWVLVTIFLLIAS